MGWAQLDDELARLLFLSPGSLRASSSHLWTKQFQGAYLYGFSNEVMGFLTWRLRANSQCKSLWENGVSQPWHYWYVGLDNSLLGFPGGASDKEPACQCRRPERCRFDPWVRKIPWRRAWQPTPVFLPENPMDRGAWWATVHSRVADSCPVHYWMFRILPGLRSLRCQ